MAQMCGKWLKYIKNGFTLLEMALQFEKILNMYEMAKTCGNWLKYLRKG